MTQTYTLSYYTKIKTPVLIRRSWWNLFGKDRIEMVEQWNLRIITDLSKIEADLLLSISTTNWNSALGKLLLRFMGNNPLLMVLLEDNTVTNKYIPTTMKDTK